MADAPTDVDLPEEEAVDNASPTIAVVDYAQGNSLSFLLGKIIDGKYRIGKIIGEGGMGTVFEADHLFLGCKLAIKVLNPGLTGSASIVKRFHNEARIAASLGHENIIEVLDMGTLENGAPFIVMEHLDGESLRDYLDAREQFPVAEAVEIIAYVLSALSVVHEAGIVHRDLKPENIFLARRGGTEEGGGRVVKLLDFGVSKVRDPKLMSMALTRTGAILGTPFYMAPEQAMGLKQIDHRADIYATGVLLFEALTGSRPFAADNYNALMVRIVSDAPPLVREYREDLPADLESLIAQAMARNQDDRFGSAAEFLEALETFAPSVIQPIRQRPTLHMERIVRRIPPPRDQVSIKNDGPPERVRSLRWTWIATAIVLALAALGVAALMSASGSDASHSSRDDERHATVPPVGSGPETDARPGVVGTRGAARADAEAGSLPDGRADGGAAVRSAPTVEVSIRVEPASARIRFDGAELERNPFVGRFPRDGAQHRVEASGPGYQTSVILVMLDQDREVEIQLEPVFIPRSGKRPPRAPPAVSPSTKLPIVLDEQNPYGGAR